ncbi:ABC transporter permease [Herpetosiphon llansteffanensis]|uniref:ABC transporter permease n=1 Tax=Herpetosiphon llansteffanensis TaxID=2094568 RepID=UPI000D7C1461|nr:ABC transporter permease [Herpetosiphon llansteffanensis]
MLKNLVRIFAFCAKELNAIRRQPLLLVGLIIGPFLILSLFGVGYQGEQPKLRTGIVVPPGHRDDPQVTELLKRISNTFLIDPERHIYESEAPAIAALENDELDLVEIFPLEMTTVYSTGKAVDIRFIYSEVDPLLRSWIEYLSYTQINELNKGMLFSVVGQSQQQIGTLRDYVSDARQQISQLREQLSGNKRAEARQTIRSLRESGALQLIALSMTQNGASETSTSTQSLSSLQASLDTLDRDLAAGGSLEKQEQQLTELDTRLSELDQQADRVQAIDPAVVVSPLRSVANNLAPIESLGDITKDPATAYVRFYTPAVLALLLQHMMVTLAGLSLVRELQQGTLEMFRVSPLSAFQTLIGKYASYTILSALIITVLVSLMVFGLGVPFYTGQLLNFALLTFMLTIASLGIGFFISSVVSTDSQAVQFSMLVLLMSVFFSGFFISIKSFLPFVQNIARGLPVTHGIANYQQIMLLNRAPATSTYIWLGGIALVSFLLSWLIFSRQFQRK